MRAGKYKLRQKSVVQLTSLLDLLFVMIFISLSQSKGVKVPEPEVKVVTKTIIKEKIVEKPVEVPVEIKKPKPIRYNITAIFNFYGTPTNPSIPEGSYRMSGTYDQKTGKLFLGGIEWINQPSSYEMVPLGGKVEASEDLFTGRIQFQGCKKFTLRKVSKSDATPISGSWKGQYDCTQGSTGLTLTIQ